MKKIRRIRRPRGIISFTFDDFPQSAAQTGAQILEKYEVLGTYYASMGLMDTEGPGGLLFTKDDLLALAERGHDIACHTYGHVDCTSVRSSDLIGQIERNARELSRVLGAKEMTSFAYPFGSISLAAKNVVSNRFPCARANLPGINTGSTDLNMLRANSIYSRKFDADRTLEMIRINEDIGGWLIFYTHHVTPEPAAFGCTSAQLETLVRSTVMSRCEVLTVAQAAASL